MKDYSSFSKAIHWITVLCVFPQIVLGVIIANQMETLFSQSVIVKFFDLHRSLGAIVLVLGILRVLANYLSDPAGSLLSLTRFERVASSIVHRSLAVLVQACSEETTPRSWERMAGQLTSRIFPGSNGATNKSVESPTANPTNRAAAKTYSFARRVRQTSLS